MHSFWHDLPDPFFVLAPMEAVTDVIFRHVVAAASAPDVYFTEFTNATGWAHAGDKAIGGRLIKTDDEKYIVAQLWGADPASMEKLARHCATLGYDGIDLNMGCPDASAVKTGGGAGMIRTPELAYAMVSAAKAGGLPVSVKTRLGYTYIDEWREWLGGLLRQDIAALTIHLRTKKEMSKVPAHFELIPEIVALRDELAPHTRLIINGDIRDRAHGLELVAQHSGVNGIMIGRGVFQNPFCFLPNPAINMSEVNMPPPLPSSPAGAKASSARRSLDAGPVAWSAPSFENPLDSSKAGAAPPGTTRLFRNSDIGWDGMAGGGSSNDSHLFSEDSGFPPAGPQDRIGRQLARPGSEEKSVGVGAGVDEEVDVENRIDTKSKLIDLLLLHLDLYDKYQSQLGRPYETLKRFYKIYIRDFDGASDLRAALMLTKNTDEVRAILGKRFDRA